MIAIDGPKWKGPDDYLSGTATPGPEGAESYGWPLGTNCWYFEVVAFGRRQIFANHDATEALRAALRWCQEQIALPAGIADVTRAADEVRRESQGE